MNRSEVQSFLIGRFILTIAVTSIVEYLLLTILNGKVLPVIMMIYFGNNYAEGRVSFITIAAAIVLTIVSLLLRLLASLLPALPGDLVSDLADRVALLMVRIFNDSGSVKGIPRVTIINQTVFLLMLMMYFILIAVPYLVSGIFYVRMVVRMMKKIEEDEHRRNMEYERRRNLMLSDIAHDIRTPITTISGYSQAITSGKVKPGELDEYLTAIRNKSGRLTELVGLLFDYVKLDSEGFEPDLKPVDICEVARECVAFLYDDMENKEMELDIDIPEEPFVVSADKIHLSRAITNLINNAVKHNEKGTLLRISVLPEGSSVTVEVADSGEKIPEEIAEHIFDPFVMGESSRSTKNGSGLGLSIVKKTVEMHGGTVELKELSGDPYTKAFVITIPGK